jgi:uncharacterized membrane protein
MPVKIPAEAKVLTFLTYTYVSRNQTNKIINKENTDCQEYETSASETKLSHLSYRHVKPA